MSDYLIEIIVKAGVKSIYAIAGDSLNPVNYSVVKDVILQWIYVRHEDSIPKRNINHYSKYYCKKGLAVLALPSQVATAEIETV